MKDAESRFTAAGASALLHIAALGLVLILRFPAAMPDDHPRSFSVIPLIAPTDRAVAIGRPAAARLKTVPIKRAPVAEMTPAHVQKVEVGAFDSASKQAVPVPHYGASGEVVVGSLDGSTATSTAVGPAGTVRSTDLFGSRSGSEGTSQPDAQASDESAQLLSVPSPSYTEEARRLNVAGSVVLAVRLTAAGGIRVLGVVCGLGHGLDQAAIEAVNQIRFRPARKAGRPIDVVANITVVFKLT